MCYRVYYYEHLNQPMPSNRRLPACLWLFGHHHLEELLVVDLTIAIDISLADHLVDLLVRELLSEAGQDLSQFSRGDVAIAILVEHFESLEDLLLRVAPLNLYHGQELGEIDGPVAISIHLVDHVSELSIGGVLAKRSHHSSELFRGDGSVSVFVEQREGLLELSDLFFSQLISHFLLLFLSRSDYLNSDFVSLNLQANFKVCENT
jgi:hypothetical protein